MNTTAVRSRRGIAILTFFLLVVALLVATQGIARPQVAHASVASGDVIFTRDGFSGCTDNLQIAQYNGSTETDLSSCSMDDQMPAVSPDGSRIVYQSETPTLSNATERGLYVMNSDGSSKTQITYDCSNDTNQPDSGDAACSTYSYTDENPSWSRDGTKIVFTRVVSASEYDIDEVNADGSGLTTLVDDDTSGSFVLTGGPSSWSPDGTKILYTYDTGGSEELYYVNPSTLSTGLVLDASYAGADGNPVWSPDGTRIYFDNGSDVYGFTYSTPSDIAQLDSAGGYEPTVSADGSTIAYTGSDAIYTISSSASMGTGTRLTATGNGDNEPAYVLASWPNADTKTIVAIGDSVAAGEGINYGFTWDNTDQVWVQNGPDDPSWLDTSPALSGNFQQCHQSGLGYPNMIALNGGNYHVYNMACTGASAMQSSGTQDGGVLDSELFDSASQPYPENGSSSDSSKTVPTQLGCDLTGVSGCGTPSTVFDGHNPDIVLLTVGANDLNFPEWISKCYNPLLGACNSTANEDEIASELTTAEAHLRLVFTELNRRAALADKTVKVYVTTYYNPFPSDSSSCIDTNGGSLGDTYPGIGITSDEQAFLVDSLGTLNDDIASEASYAAANDSSLSVHVVDLSDVMDGHQWCTEDPWVYGVSIDYPINDGELGTSDNPAPFHPTPEGQRAIYEAVMSAITS